MSKPLTAWCVEPQPHEWRAVKGRHLHFAGYRLPAPDAPDPTWIYHACRGCGAVLSQPPPEAAAQGDSLDVERLLRVLEVLWRAGHATIRDKTEARFVAREIAREYAALAAAEETPHG